MRLVSAFMLLAACSPDEPMLIPDAGVLVGLTEGAYELEWTCLDGCRPLPFPPATFNRLDVQSGLVMRWYTEGAASEMDTDGAADDDCVTSGPLEFSEGSTAPIQFCPADYGPEATVVYTAEFGDAQARTYGVKAIPLPPG
jgi:hypothetical protein